MILFKDLTSPTNETSPVGIRKSTRNRKVVNYAESSDTETGEVFFQRVSTKVISVTIIDNIKYCIYFFRISCAGLGDPNLGIYFYRFDVSVCMCEEVR